MADRRHASRDTDHNRAITQTVVAGDAEASDSGVGGQRSRSMSQPWVFSVLLSLLLVLLLALFWQMLSGDPAQPAPTDDMSLAVSPPPVIPDGPITPDGTVLGELSRASERVAAAISPSVVRIEAEDVRHDSQANDEFSQLFGITPPLAEGQGSGMIITEDGHVLTNHHVIRSAKRVTVITDQQVRYAAEVVGSDALTDLALLKIPAEDLPAISWGDSDELRMGSFVWAVGSPFGLQGSVSFGIVSAKQREGLSRSIFQEFLQTDAAVNPGNSGGPLVDAAGRVIGVNTAILGDSFQGISFAIPSNTAKEIIERLREKGRVARGWLGLSLNEVTPERAAQINLPRSQGVIVESVALDAGTPSPAEQAGLRAGDVLLTWEGQPIADPIHFSRLVAKSPIGSEAQVTIWRDGEERSITVAVGERP